ncbi:vitamin K epoxide reductase family protein [Candidatus Gottesmanbacteria bacterium]|nr:vitamin K epoxide reductase family protein [Candidatus Gottesmanbacteria bacterium]MBI3576861.1 vitamin K epoxide reductase family protein [Candidatus Gottesmanbacteria bacterium]
MANVTAETIKLSNRIVFILALLGVVMAFYVLQSWLRQTSIICLTGGGCEAVRKSAVSYPFGIPVPAVGLVGYAVIAVLAFLKTTSQATWITKALLGMTIFGVCFVSWFTYMELFVIRAVCTWCAVSAVNMYILFFLVIRSIGFANTDSRKK